MKNCTLLVHKYMMWLTFFQIFNYSSNLKPKRRRRCWFLRLVTLFGSNMVLKESKNAGWFWFLTWLMVIVFVWDFKGQLIEKNNLAKNSTTSQNLLGFVDVAQVILWCCTRYCIHEFFCCMKWFFYVAWDDLRCFMTLQQKNMCCGGGNFLCRIRWSAIWIFMKLFEMFHNFFILMIWILMCVA